MHRRHPHLPLHRCPRTRRGAGLSARVLRWRCSGTFGCSWRCCFAHGFDVIHACNPPDLIFLVGGFFKLFLGKSFIFDHHDINPELYEAKFGRQGLLLQADAVPLER